MYRQIITAKDVQKIFGKKTRSSFSILSKVRTELKKEKHHQILISDFCTYFNINCEEIVAIIHKYDREELEKLQRLKAEKQKKIDEDAEDDEHKPYEFAE